MKWQLSVIHTYEAPTALLRFLPVGVSLVSNKANQNIPTHSRVSLLNIRLHCPYRCAIISKHISFDTFSSVVHTRTTQNVNGIWQKPPSCLFTPVTARVLCRTAFEKLLFHQRFRDGWYGKMHQKCAFDTVHVDRVRNRMINRQTVSL